MNSLLPSGTLPGKCKALTTVFKSPGPMTSTNYLNFHENDLSDFLLKSLILCTTQNN